jgi:hypothetical protein
LFLRLTPTGYKSFAPLRGAWRPATRHCCEHRSSGTRQIACVIGLFLIPIGAAIQMINEHPILWFLTIVAAFFAMASALASWVVFTRVKRLPPRGA